MEEQLTLKVEGMTCGHCEKRVSDVLKALEGVEKSEVSLNDGEAVVVFQKEELSKEEIIKAINNTEIYKAREK